MEAFSRPPPTTNTTINKEQPESYQSLSQFDEELQQQALLAMEQEIEAWKDFENYLPPVDGYYNTRQFNDTTRYNQQPTNTSNQQSVMNRQLVDLVANTGLPMRQSNTYNNPWPSQELNSKTTLAEIEPSASPPLNNPSLSPFGSPDSILHDSDTMQQYDNSQQFFQQQQLSPISAYHTPSKTPTNSPKDDIFTAPVSFRVQQNKLLPIQPYQGKILIFCLWFGDIFIRNLFYIR